MNRETLKNAIIEVLAQHLKTQQEQASKKLLGGEVWGYSWETTALLAPHATKGLTRGELWGRVSAHLGIKLEDDLLFNRARSDARREKKITYDYGNGWAHADLPRAITAARKAQDCKNKFNDVRRYLRNKAEEVVTTGAANTWEADAAKVRWQYQLLLKEDPLTFDLDAWRPSLEALFLQSIEDSEDENGVLRS